jgi:hypothetical protein
MEHDPAIYLVSMRLPKMEYVDTAAVSFLVFCHISLQACTLRGRTASEDKKCNTKVWAVLSF